MPVMFTQTSQRGVFQNTEYKNLIQKSHRLRSERPEFDSLPYQKKVDLPLYCVQTGSGFHPVFHPVVTGIVHD